MLQSSNVDVADALRKFSDAGIECGFLVPTRTGLEKSIMDATEELREVLLSSGLHDYSNQAKGSDNKVLLPTLLISGDAVVETQTSLYRPETKEGDPRIWVSQLAKYAQPTDLLALFGDPTRLLVVNVSRSNLVTLLQSPTSLLWRNFRPQAASLPPEAVDLHGLISEVYRKGYIKTLRVGDTGVGFTLETLLGIQANSSKAPDYRGIEIKAGRLASHVSGRTTVLSQVPNWSISRLKGSLDLLRERGRFSEEKGRQQLFHQIGAIKPNSYGMLLVVDHDNDLLHQDCVKEGVSTRDVSWQFSKLYARLLEKHKQTFWVKADTRGKGESEEFWYNSVRYTSGVSPTKLPILIEAGIVSVDYTITQQPSGAAKDQGYLFRMKQADLPLLFRSPQTLTLS